MSSGMGVLPTAVGQAPRVEVLYMVDDIASMTAIDRPPAPRAQPLEMTCGQPQIMGRLRGVQKRATLIPPRLVIRHSASLVTRRSTQDSAVACEQLNERRPRWSTEQVVQNAMCRSRMNRHPPSMPARAASRCARSRASASFCSGSSASTAGRPSSSSLLSRIEGHCPSTLPRLGRCCA